MLATLKPPQERKDTAGRARQWATAVRALYGTLCYMHTLKDPKSKVPAVHAAHIIKRSRMGSALAYGPKQGPVEPRLGRPLCVSCHIRQESGLEPEYEFPLADRIEAVTIHNSYAKSKLPVPS